MFKSKTRRLLRRVLLLLNDGLFRPKPAGNRMTFGQRFAQYPASGLSSIRLSTL
jgi:hypothetical protein